VLYNELVQRGAVVELEQLPNALTEQSSFVDFYPGQAAGKIFNIEMDQGQALVPIADFNEFLRSLHMPSNLRSMGAALMAYLHLYMSYDPGQPLLDMYSLGPQFGHNRLFPEQELFSQEIVHTLLEGGTKGEAMRLLWQAYQWLGTGKMGEELSEKLIIEQDSAFNTRFSQQHWADGDAYDQAIPESFLHRTNIQFRIAALQL
jgi:hypothetical protein